MQSNDISWDLVTPGTEIPPLVKHPSPMQLFMFSAVTWNRHLIHYNTEFAISDGLQNIAVHRALIGGFIAQMLTNWLGEAGSIRSVEWSVRGSAAVEKPLTLKGTVTGMRTERGEQVLDCEVWAENHKGETIAPGTAMLVLSS